MSIAVFYFVVVHLELLLLLIMLGVNSKIVWFFARSVRRVGRGGNSVAVEKEEKKEGYLEYDSRS